MICINVARAEGRNWNGTGPQYVHFFDTEIGAPSARTLGVIDEITRAFPAPQYHVSITEWQTTGREVSRDDVRARFATIGRGVY